MSETSGLSKALVERMVALLTLYRDECRSCNGSGIYRVKKGGQGRQNRPEDFIESPCHGCAEVRALLADIPRPRP